MTTKQQKLKKLLDQLDNFGKKEKPLAPPSFHVIDSGYLKELDSKLSSLDIAPIIQLVKELQTEITKSEENLKFEFENQISSLPQTPDLTKDVTKLKTDFNKKFKTLQEENLSSLKGVEQKLQEFIDSDAKEDVLMRAEIDKQLKEIRLDVLARMQKGGGSMPLQVNVNSSVISVKYADINFKDSTSIAWTKSDDTTNKRVNISASVLMGGSGGGGGSAFGIISVSGQSNVVASVASDTLNLVAGTNITLTTTPASNSITITSAGGGSVTGISRTTSIITANTTGGTNSGTDYVYLANAGLQFTLPTAIGNNNLYTVKNLAVTSVLIGVTAGQAIDGASTALLASQYQSVDLISNGSIWSVI